MSLIEGLRKLITPSAQAPKDPASQAETPPPALQPPPADVPPEGDPIAPAPSIDDLQHALDELRTQTMLDELSAQGHLAADPETRAAAEKLAAADPIALATVLRAAKPAPAGTTVRPPAGPAADTTELAIQERIRATGEPYHVAAAAVGTALPRKEA